MQQPAKTLITIIGGTLGNIGLVLMLIRLTRFRPPEETLFTQACAGLVALATGLVAFPLLLEPRAEHKIVGLLLLGFPVYMLIGIALAQR